MYCFILAAPCGGARGKWDNFGADMSKKAFISGNMRRGGSRSRSCRRVSCVTHKHSRIFGLLTCVKQRKYGKKILLHKISIKPSIRARGVCGTSCAWSLASLTFPLTQNNVIQEDMLSLNAALFFTARAARKVSSVIPSVPCLLIM